ncbi:geobacillin-26 family protein [Bacillus cereus]|uniref:geobacillin-26 family protein n=1 Tax=Bacillus cereus TaxID=1396 RepID=UPI003D64AEEA
MKIRKNKIIVSALTLGLLTSITPTGAFAETNDSVISALPSKNIQQVEQPIIKILKEDANEKIVESKDSNIVVTSTYDKKSKVLNITTKKIADNSSTTETINIPSANEFYANANKKANYAMEVLDRAVSLDGAFEYTYYKGNVWVIKIPSVDYAKNPLQTSENKADLNGFRTSVNNLMTNEVSFLSKVGGEIGIACLTLLRTPNPWTVIAGAAGAIGLAAWAVPDLYKVFVEADNATYYFHQVN